MKGAVEARKERVSFISRKLEKELSLNGKVDYERFVVTIQIETGVTDKKAREYMRLIMVNNDLTTSLEENKTGRVYWIEPKK